SVPDATAAVSYATPATSYGYQVNAVGPGKLDGRPVVVDQPFGSGRVVLIGFDPFYRAWHEGSERMALNAALYPTGPAIPAGAPTPPAAALTATRSRALPAVALPSIASRPALTVTTGRDIRIGVATHDAAALRRAVRAAA